MKKYEYEKQIQKLLKAYHKKFDWQGKEINEKKRQKRS
jgi:hypothetical protein